MNYYDDDYWYGTPLGESKNKHVDPSIHVMNKDESKALRKLMSETGMTEDEIREIKKYRKLLSEAQKEGTKENKWYHPRQMFRRNYRGFALMRKILIKDGLQLLTPAFREAFATEMREAYDTSTRELTIDLYIRLYPSVKKYF